MIKSNIKSEYLINISKRIKYYLDLRQMKAKSLADAIGVTANAISLIVNGKTTPSIDSLHQIAIALNVEDWQLLTDKILISQEEVEKKTYPIEPDFIALIKSGKETYSASSVDEAIGILEKLKK